MVKIKRVVLDILKPHHPNALDFAQAIAEIGAEYRVNLTVIEVDENTETLQVVVEGDAINFDSIQDAVNGMGGSLHSIDQVEVYNSPNEV